MSNPKAFISYAWESDKIKAWVKKFATQLRTDGVDVKLDQWELALGDQIPHFMERSVKGNDYVLIICTPKYKEKSDDRIGGVGYEGDIMTAEVIKTSNHRKFIPVLKLGTEETSIPSWLGGAFYVDLSDKVKYEKNYPDLTTTLLNQREPAPKIGQVSNVSNSDAPVDETSPQIVNVDVKIKGIVVDEVT